MNREKVPNGGVGMEKEDRINTMAALLTSGFIINTAFDIEDVNEALKTFRRFKHEFENLENTSDDKEIIEDIAMDMGMKLDKEDIEQIASERSKKEM